MEKEQKDKLKAKLDKNMKFLYEMIEQRNSLNIQIEQRRNICTNLKMWLSPSFRYSFTTDGMIGTEKHINATVYLRSIYRGMVGAIVDNKDGRYIYIGLSEIPKDLHCEMLPCERCNDMVAVGDAILHFSGDCLLKKHLKQK